jgi:hypothetical protein
MLLSLRLAATGLLRRPNQNRKTMNTQEKDALTLRTAAPEAPDRPLTPSATPSLDSTSFDGRLINFIRSAPLFLNLEHGKADPKDLAALTSHLNESFPELRTFRARLQHTKKRRDDLTRTLTRFMRGSYPQLAALMDEDADPKNTQRNSVIDHSALLMWELSEAEERYHKLAEEINTLETTLEEAVEAPYQRFVRWAVRESR